jgi:putative redox protein
MTEKDTAPASTPKPKPPSHVGAAWRGDHRFDTGRLNGPLTLMDGSGSAAQSPPDALLSSLASCSGVDVLDILAKRRTPVESLMIDVEGERREQMPRRFERIHLTYRVAGAGIERVHAERAVQLAFEKYCSVAASLAPDIVVTTEVEVNGETGEAVRQKMFSPTESSTQ